MGYTRYWERTTKKYDKGFIEKVNEILADCADKGIIIRNGFGQKKPVVNLSRIWINGNKETDLDHETFAISNPACKYYKSGFDFCKTAQKPYDYAVREILKVAEEMGIVENVSDDGEWTACESDFVYLNGREPFR